MLWVLHIIDSLLDHDHDLDLDLEYLPLLGLVMSLSTPAMSLCSITPASLALAHILWPATWYSNWFLLPHLWHFLPNAGHSLYACVMLHLLQVLSVLPLGANCLLHLSFHFYCLSFHIWNILIMFTSHQLGDSSVWLVMVEIFHCHLMFLGVLK